MMVESPFDNLLICWNHVDGFKSRGRGWNITETKEKSEYANHLKQGLEHSKAYNFLMISSNTFIKISETSLYNQMNKISKYHSVSQN